MQDAWKEYNDKLNQTVDETNEGDVHAWNRDSQDLFINLLYAISGYLSFDFDKVQLRRGIYYPRAHGEQETRQRQIQEGLLKTLTGNTPLKMDVVGFPITPEAAENQQNLQRALLDALRDGTLQVSLARPVDGDGA